MSQSQNFEQVYPMATEITPMGYAYKRRSKADVGLIRKIGANYME